MSEVPANVEKQEEDRLDQVLAETEAALKELRAELALRRQHEAIDNLPQYLAESTNRWENIRIFIEELVSELRGNKQEENKDA